MSFDVAFGTSGGGLCALMIGKLGMPITGAIGELLRVSKAVFGEAGIWKNMKILFKGRYSAGKLLQEISAIPGSNQTMQPHAGPCQSYVVCRVSESTWPYRLLPPAECLSTYNNGNINCTVAEAGRATSAAPTYFDPARIPASPDLLYVDGGLGFNNPIMTITYPSQKPGIIPAANEVYVSIGTGKPPITVQNNVRNGWRPLERLLSMLGLFQAIEQLQDAATDTENAHIWFEFVYLPLWSSGRSVEYFRFNCEDIWDIGMDEWNQHNKILQKTNTYLGQQQTIQDIRRCAALL
ncbi:hypothetical protein FOPG_19122 [Fusarium oxysporum f. sp. conglutinans race 2 54008]|uniref:PNPLA domain-containing protein n=1 Tax=Fusarium oxysporum f. sp. conglutinans race 2 54008 TaxID=1089457 RepID=X0GXQ3_FUSOX|nr:hypothetical protein FOPG_19122 [Fusarium oxysporum f. sp. conglutinans race 2 54008]